MSLNIQNIIFKEEGQRIFSLTFFFFYVIIDYIRKNGGIGMKAAYVKCLYCGERFNRNDLNIPTKQVSARRYAHLSCWEKHQSEMSQEERDMEAFFEYILFHMYVYQLLVILSFRLMKIQAFHQLIMYHHLR